MKLKSLKPILSQATSSVKKFKKTEPQLFWVISICLTLSLSLTITVLIKLSVIKQIKTPTITNTIVDNTQPRITGAWEVIPTTDPTVNNNQTSDVIYDYTKYDFSKINWLSKQQKIESMSVLKPETPTEPTDSFYYYLDKANYYLVGNFNDGTQLIYLYLLNEGPGDYYSLIRVIKSPKGDISVLSNDTTNNINYYISDKVKINVAIQNILEPPKTIIIDNNTFTSGYSSNKIFDTLVNPKLIKETDYGDFYVVYTDYQNYPLWSRRQFYLKTKDSLIYPYSLDTNLLTDNSTINFKWLDGDQNASNFGQKTSTSCGGSSLGPDIIKNNDSALSSKIKIAEINNQSIYQIKDSNSQILKELYSNHKVGRDSDYSNVISYEDFIKAKNHFIYQDFLGDWLIFINNDYGSMAECAKPVIYLYPPKDTPVKVQVGAQITQSEPTYPETGWLVTAKPNGELIYQNQSYPYLFWEGLGNGIYPDYRNQGTLVSQKDLIPTVYKQLSQLGLNQKESADFMEFWQPKLPKTPYIRLTWLNTKDMDTLAPLNVSPKPDTSIRIFLEFEGLDQPVKLIPQTLSAPKRNGFTLIEWGGLLLKARE